MDSGSEQCTRGDSSSPNSWSFYTSYEFNQCIRRCRQTVRVLTNNFDLSALTIAELYKCRWQVELFFKWIKQYLRIKAFYGTSVNAVKTQVWIAVCVYVLMVIVKKELRVERSIGEILQILSICLFEKTPILQAFSHDFRKIENNTVGKQLYLFDI